MALLYARGWRPVSGWALVGHRLTGLWGEKHSPSPVVQVDDERVIPELLEGLVVMAIHVSCRDSNVLSGL